MLLHFDDLTKIDTEWKSLDASTKTEFLLAWDRGENVEYKEYAQDKWLGLVLFYGFNPTCWYRIRPKTLRKDVYPWSSVHPDYKWAARDQDDSVWFFASKPKILEDVWENVDFSGDFHLFDDGWLSGYEKGEVYWTYSLQERP